MSNRNTADQLASDVRAIVAAAIEAAGNGPGFSTLRYRRNTRNYRIAARGQAARVMPSASLAELTALGWDITGVRAAIAEKPELFVALSSRLPDRSGAGWGMLGGIAFRRS